METRAKMTAKSQQFLNELALFYRNKGHFGVNSQHFVARLNGQPVNLWDLYSCVLEMGGSCKVNLSSQWDEVYTKLFKTPPIGANVSVALRQIYQRYLTPYEKVNYSNFSSDVLDDEDDDSLSLAKDLNTNFVIHSSFVNPQQPQQISANTCVNPMNKLFCSLLCGLPNEIELGLRVATLMANSKDVEDIADFKFIDVLLECLSMYACFCNDEYEESECNRSDGEQISKECLCLERFWCQMCKDKSVFELVFGSLDLNLLLNHSPHIHQRIYSRVKRIAELIRNLSYCIDDTNQKSEEDVPNGPNYFNCATLRLLKFLLLLLSSEDQNLNNIGFDILSNIIVSTTVIDDEQYLLIQQSLFRHCVATFISSNDVYSINRCLEVITKLISVSNESMLALLDDEISQRLTEFLTCQHDVGVVISSLECCHALSQHNPKLLLNRNKHFLSEFQTISSLFNQLFLEILLNLLNCEASQHFTSSALKKIRIVDERPQKLANDVSSTSTLSVNVVPNRVSTGQTSVAVDNETFAMNWLRSTFEVKVPSSKQSATLRVSDMYADHVKYCCRNGRRNVITAQLFTQIIKRCFPSSAITANSCVEGIIVKIQSTASKPQSQLASPILKAHLSAPPKTTSGNSQTSTPTTTTSTLIKNLLANKLRSNTVSTSTSTTPTKTLSSANTSNNSSNVAVAGAVKASVITCNPSSNLKPSPLTVSSSTLVNDSDTKSNPLNSITSSVISSLTTNNSISVLVTNSNGLLTSTAPSSSSITTSSPSNTCITSLTNPHSQAMTSNPLLIGTPPVVTSTAMSQQPQQFLLVRTIFTSPQQQGTPVRLILPATVFNQQRPVVSNITVNGVAGNTPPTQTSASVPTSSASVTSTNDILLKAVLGSGIVSESSNNTPPSPIRTNAVKSSPLLNVLLDKGKLPDFSTMAATVSQTVPNNTTTTSAVGSSAVTAVSVPSVVNQQPKMFILTTKSPLAIKSLPNLQQGQLTNQQVPQMQPLQQNMVMQQQSQPVQQSSSQVQNVQQQPLQQSQTQSNSIQPSLHVQVIPNSSSGSNIQQSQSQSVPKEESVKNKLLQINSNEIISNGDVSMDSFTNQTDSAVGNLVINDLSPIKDIRKTVDDATKLISKRPNEDASAEVAQKKSKVNATVNSVSNTAVKSSIAVKGVKNYGGNHVKSVTSAESVKTVTETTTTSEEANKCDTDSVKLSTTTCLITSTATVTTTKTVATAAVQKQLHFVCEWNGCKRTFTNPSKVYIHVHDTHVSDTGGMMSCQWGGPEGIGPGCQSSRPKLSLLTHLQDFHCNPSALHQAALRNQQIANTGSTSVSPPQPPPEHPGYAVNAALLAIKRHAINYVEPPVVQPVTPTTPLTASIRLTAALTLRNLCAHSTSIRRTLQSYEPYLNELCIIEGRDESRTIAQCLAVIIDNKGSGN
ncbi:AT-rich interactive domain-containing protein 2-like protein [Leptotrombidium deliense]|uniref:AT-rich interactive domain-containing protein 2-like protein n=1 Tax=Leptotrombidium deliense TaxID=299467 RepID=A0A443SI15_9ACAR|nr:AT-rich interactive domain-containing protein 2-like protein [Leptotrombidium deliense]